MMMKTINNIFSWGISSGFFVALVWFLWGYVRPLLEAKKQHAKTVQQRETLDMLLKFADTAVASLTSRTDLAGHDKFKLATQQVRETMEAKGLSVTEGMIQDAVQAAYEKSPLTPTTIPEVKLDNLGQKVPDFAPGTVEAIDPTKGDNQ